MQCLPSPIYETNLAFIGYAKCWRASGVMQFLFKIHILPINEVHSPELCYKVTIEYSIAISI